MKHLRIFAGLILLLTSALTQATMIHYAGFTHDTNTDITTGQGLEWRLATDYDYSQGMDPQTGQHATDGWRIATTKEMHSNLNAFLNSSATAKLFGSDENTRYSDIWAWVPSNFENIMQFTSMFGGRPSNIPVTRFNQGWSWSSIRFGEDLDGDGKLNVFLGAVYWFNPEYFEPKLPEGTPLFFNPLTETWVMPDTISLNLPDDNYDDTLGRVMLVRTLPEPISFALLLIGLVGFFAKVQISRAFQSNQ